MELTSQQGKINTGEGNNMIESIKIRGLKQNDLKNISLDIPKNKIVVFTGVSGSGKSSIVFDRSRRKVSGR